MSRVFGSKIPTADAIESAFSGDGIKATLSRISVKGNAIVFDLDYLDAKGRIVGNVVRKFERVNGELNVFHDYFFLDPSKQGKDTALKVLRNSFAAYLDLGVSNVSLHAEKVGRYAWAKYGWQWAADTATKVAVQLAKYLIAEGYSQHIAQVMAADLALHPWRIADLVRPPKPGEPIHKKDSKQAKAQAEHRKIGKRFLLQGDGWSGTIKLSPGAPEFERLKQQLQLPTKSQQKALSTTLKHWVMNSC